MRDYIMADLAQQYGYSIRVSGTKLVIGEEE